MKILTLEYIASYLPFGLKVMRPDNKTVLEVIGATKGFYYFKEKGMSLGDINCVGNKPILRPLADLTKEIEHKGNRFIPILELAKIVSPDWNNVRVYISGVNHCMDMQAGYFGFDEAIKSFFYRTITNVSQGGNVIDHTITQHKLFKKLYEWHFDVENLISEGLAISYKEARIK